MLVLSPSVDMYPDSWAHTTSKHGHNIDATSLLTLRLGAQSKMAWIISVHVEMTKVREPRYFVDSPKGGEINGSGNSPE